MAATNDQQYCQNDDMLDNYPDIIKFNNRTRIMGWKAGPTNFIANINFSSLDLYYADGTGHIRDLYWDGAQMHEQAYATTAKTTLTLANSLTATSFAVADEGGLALDDICKINNEYFKLRFHSFNRSIDLQFQ